MDTMTEEKVLTEWPPVADWRKQVVAEFNMHELTQIGLDEECDLSPIRKQFLSIKLSTDLHKILCKHVGSSEFLALCTPSRRGNITGITARQRQMLDESVHGEWVE